ncbi:MAG: hypothetical protein U0359_11080 [Byssovorax sp.]
MRRALRSLVLVLVSIAALAGCDPAGPAASGKITLGDGIDPASFQTLELRAAPDFGMAFDPAHPNFVPDKSWLDNGGDLKDIKFPFDYTIGQPLGTTEQQHWRVIGWLSKGASGTAGALPASGEPFGTQAFDLIKCGIAGGFCATTSGVDFTIDKTAP